jgi:hypothetical protein
MLALLLPCDDLVAYAAMLLVECPITTIDAPGNQFVH